MMVVMLIMSIIMAAFAPVVTTRNKSGDNSERWRWARNRSDIYYGIADTQVAMIGQNEREATDPSSKLLISTIEDGQSHILFKHATNAGAGTILGQLFMDDKGNYGLTTSQLKGSQNTAFGSGALINVTDSVAGDNGTKNTAIGYEALKSNTSGYFNTAVGELSLSDNTSGYRNVSMGNSSMAKNTTGQDNVSIGVESLLSNLSGSQNVSIGDSALHNNQTGNNNTAVGYHALYSNDNGYNNVAIGLNSLKDLTSGAYNISLGYDSMIANQDGVANIAIGNNALAYSQSADSNIAIGNFAMSSNSYKDSTHNIAIGENAMKKSDGLGNIAIGYNALHVVPSDVSNVAYSIAIGFNADVSGNSSIAIGYLSNAARASESVVLGREALAQGNMTATLGSYAETRANYATALGPRAKAVAFNGVAVGFQSYAQGMDAIAIGTESKSAQNGIAIGKNATTDNPSIAIGDGASAHGRNNIAIGTNACSNVFGSNKVCIGANSGPKSGSWSTDSSERIFIGGRSKFNGGAAVLEVHNDGVSRSTLRGSSNDSSVVINGNLVLKGALILPVIDRYGYNVHGLRMFERYGEDETNASLKSGEGDFKDFVNTYYSSKAGQYNPFSDRRLKYVGGENKSGLDKIRELKVFNFTFKKDKTKTPHVGVIAQDLQKVFPDAVSKGEDGFLRIRIEDMFYALINAVKELDSKITELTNQVKILQEQNKQIIKQNKAIEARLKALEARK